MDKLIAVVTGGTRGIGLGIAEALLKRGASVAITFKNDEASAEAAQRKLEGCLQNGAKILLLQGDIADPESVAAQYRQVTQELGGINVLVNNAGIMTKRSFEEITPEDWNETLRVNLNGAFYWCSQVIPGMKANRCGHIVNISSLAARGGGVVGPHYAARELGPFGITVNAIAPAFIEDAGIFVEWNEDQIESLKDNVVVPRIGNVHDVVRAFEYLLDSSYVTGVALDVSGGAFMI
jgi:3-oxoacyl-[acyl-carrier protein] reductase